MSEKYLRKIQYKVYDSIKIKNARNNITFFNSKIKSIFLINIPLIIDLILFLIAFYVRIASELYPNNFLIYLLLTTINALFWMGTLLIIGYIHTKYYVYINSISRNKLKDSNNKSLLNSKKIINNSIIAVFINLILLTVINIDLLSNFQDFFYIEGAVYRISYFLVYQTYSLYIIKFLISIAKNNNKAQIDRKKIKVLKGIFFSNILYFSIFLSIIYYLISPLIIEFMLNVPTSDPILVSTFLIFISSISQWVFFIIYFIKTLFN